MYPYHNKIKQRIKNNELLRYEYVEKYKSISPCLLLYFETEPKIRPIAFALVILLITSFYGCKNEQPDQDEQMIRQLHEDYVSGWLSGDEEKIIGLLVEDSRIQPNSMKTIEGKKSIRDFWFPRDGSQTLINNYTTEIISLNILDTLAVSTHTSHLDWTYKKDSLDFGMLQKGINTTLYKKQADGTWKIWRSMWTDTYSETK
ncbi:nuclear transport factor 2 family protein [uncultured Eudoraea sp.]|uniref:YybH family protein n=1 Tax=uncultured Eudoraea sp. TaxID=1035614 RepID=UPI002608E3E8|nr:nuclear transport factor 2 family protein [uncultured Eudoraea sp.]